MALKNLQKIIANKQTLFQRVFWTDSTEIEITEGKINFTWFPYTTDSDEIAAYTQFISRLCDMARDAKGYYESTHPQSWMREGDHRGLCRSDHGRDRKRYVPARQAYAHEEGHPFLAPPRPFHHGAGLCPCGLHRLHGRGETMYIWGKQYFLVFKPDNQKNSFEIQNQNIVLSMSAKSTVKQRDAYIKEEYRKILKEEIEKRLPKWEAQTGLKCDSWQTKYMVTKWGACSTDKKKLWFNLQLAQKPYACLDYIILHELTHLLTRKHDATFIAHMDRHMPN